MAKGDDIEERLVDFAVRIVKLCSALPTNYVGSHLGKQLVRSGTSPALNYAEARGAESKRDFIHKLRIVLKELKESEINLRIIRKSDLLSEKKMKAIMQECDELCRIVNASIQTARQPSVPN